MGVQVKEDLSFPGLLKTLGESGAAAEPQDEASWTNLVAAV